MNCYIHPSIAAVTTCTQCGEGICADCTMRVGKTTYCIRCAPATAQPQRREKGSAGLTAAAATGALAAIPLGVIVLVLLCVLAAVVVIIILALLGPVIGNIFSNIVVGI